MVTDCEGNHRFNYIGQTLDSGLEPTGICTNMLSQIFVCDTKSKTVYIVNKDGKYLSRLIMDTLRLFTPNCLGYDASSNTLWVGCNDRNLVCVYSYSSQ